MVGLLVLLLESVVELGLELGLEFALVPEEVFTADFLLFGFGADTVFFTPLAGADFFTLAFLVAGMRDLSA